MKALITACSFVAAVWFWDATYNHHRLTNHVDALQRDIRHHMFR